MDEIISDFYVTLPSNSSMRYFPGNTQSSYRTKLSSPLVLNADWEVALSEIFIPKSWYNIDDHNNTYSVTFETETRVLTAHIEHEIRWTYEIEESAEDFCANINLELAHYVDIEDKVKFLTEEEEGKVRVELNEGLEIHIDKQKAPKLLYMLHLPAEDAIIKTNRVYKYRPTTQPPTMQVFTVVNKNFKSINQFIIPVTSIKGVAFSQTGRGLSQVLNDNVRLLDLEDVVKFTFEPWKREMAVNIAENAEIRLTADASSSLMRKLNIVGDTTLRGMQKFKLNPLIPVEQGDSLLLIIKEHYETLIMERKTENCVLVEGMYKNAESLFASFKHIHLTQLPNGKVTVKVLPKYEANLSKGLAEMLGFTDTFFAEGSHVSKYPLDLDAGITEIFVYSDLVASHHVGDIFAPLLRVVPCMPDDSERIVRHYHRPLYFPVKKTFLETIEIELRSSFGSKITFSGGKTHVVLSFRRKKL